MAKAMAIRVTHDRVMEALAQEIRFEGAPVVLDMGTEKKDSECTS